MGDVKNSDKSASGKIYVKTLPTSRKFPKLLMWYMIKARLARLFRKKTAWATAGFPIEFLWAYDVFPLHPENNACISAARKISEELIEYAESLGFSRDLCSYMKTNIGAYDRKVAQSYGGIFKPHFAVCTGTICDTHVKWFQTQARRMGVPLFVFDVPHYVSGSDEKVMERYVDYVVEQIYEFMDFMYDMTGKKMTEKKLRKVLVKSDRLCELWQEIYRYRRMIPSPMGYADTLSDIFPLVVLPGIDKGIKFYEKLLEDVKRMVEEKKGVIPEERFRILFEGIPMWYNIKFFHRLAVKYGAVVTYEPYTYSFGPRKPLNLDYENTLRAIAKLMIHFPYNYNLETRIRYFREVIREYSIDGVILHNNMSCRPNSAGMIDLKEALKKDPGVPVLILDCDMNDPRAYSENQIMNRIESFIEMLENKKYGKGSV